MAGETPLSPKVALPDTPWNDIPIQYLPCPHRHFKTDVVPRDKLSPEQYSYLLSTPRGYRWIQQAAIGNTDPKPLMVTPSAKRKKTSLLHPPEQQYAGEFLSEVLKLLSPQVTRGKLTDEFRLSEEEAELFTKELKGKKKIDSAVNTKVRERWLKEYKRIMSAKLIDYVASVMSSRRSHRTHYIASTLLNHFSDLTGEHCSLSNPRNRVQRIQVYIADRFAAWLANIMSETDKEICKEFFEKSLNQLDHETEEINKKYKNNTHKMNGKKKKTTGSSKKTTEEDEKNKKTEVTENKALEEQKNRDRGKQHKKKKGDKEKKQKEKEDKKKKEEEEKTAEKKEKQKQQEGQKRKMADERKKREEEKKKKATDRNKGDEDEEKLVKADDKKKKEGTKTKNKGEGMRQEEKKKIENEKKKKKQKLEDETLKKEEEKRKNEEDEKKKKEEIGEIDEEEKDKEKTETGENKDRDIEKGEDEEEDKKKKQDEEEDKIKGEGEVEKKKGGEDKKKGKKKEEDKDKKKKDDDRKKKHEEHSKDEKIKSKEGAGDVFPANDPLEVLRDWVEDSSGKDSPSTQEQRESYLAAKLGHEVKKNIGVKLSPEEENKVTEITSKYSKWMSSALSRAENDQKRTTSSKGGKVTYYIKKTEGKCYYDVKKIDERKVCDMTKVARMDKVAIISESICKRPVNRGPLKSSKEMKEWAEWAANVVELAEKWANWIDKTCNEAEAKVGSEAKEGQDWHEFKRATEIRALELRRNKKYIKETAKIWDEKFKNNDEE